MPLNKSQIHKILVISLTNIGDVILTFPVIDALKEEFPHAQLSVVIGPKARSLLEGNPNLYKVYIYNKRQSGFQILKLLWQLKRDGYDLLVDLRNTAIPFFLGTRHRTSFWTVWESYHFPKLLKIPFLRRPSFLKMMMKTAQQWLPLNIKGKPRSKEDIPSAARNFLETDDRHLHMKDKHLLRLKTIVPNAERPKRIYAIDVSDGDRKLIQEMITKDISVGQKFIILAPGAANHQKRWSENGFAEVGDHLYRTYHLKSVLIGSDEDQKVIQKISKRMIMPFADFCGRLSLTQLAELMTKARLAVVNDSAPMHLASYLDLPVLALFGPSDPKRYGPWGVQSGFLSQNKLCPACQDPLGQSLHNCLSAISSKDVINALDVILRGVTIRT